MRTARFYSVIYTLLNRSLVSNTNKVEHGYVRHN